MHWFPRPAAARLRATTRPSSAGSPPSAVSVALVLVTATAGLRRTGELGRAKSHHRSFAVIPIITMRRRRCRPLRPGRRSRFRPQPPPPFSPRAAACPGHLSQVRRFADVDAERDPHRMAVCRGIPPRASPGPNPELCREAPSWNGRRARDEPLPGDFPGKAQGVPARGSCSGRAHVCKERARQSQRTHARDEQETRVEYSQLME